MVGSGSTSSSTERPSRPASGRACSSASFVAKVGARSSASLGVCIEGAGFRASAKRAAALLAGVRVRGVTLKIASTNAECASWVVSQVDARLPAAHLAATAERLRAELQAGTLRSGEWMAVRA